MCVCSDATCILKIDPLKQRAITFGKVSTKKNKWQGGVLCPSDGCVYAVPADMDNVLKIHTGHDTSTNKYNEIDFIDVPPPTDVEDKWQGGFLAQDGTIYGIPVSITFVHTLVSCIIYLVPSCQTHDTSKLHILCCITNL